MESVRSLQKQLLCSNLPSQVVGSPAPLLIQAAVELIVDVGVANDVSAGISQQRRFNSPDLFVLSLLGVIQSQEFKQFRVPSFADRIVQPAYLTQCFRQDLKLDRIIGRMFNEGVPGCKL